MVGEVQMDIYESLGVRPIINAAGTYTVLGGSCMSEQTLLDMAEASRSFVQIRKLQSAVHTALAKLTHNEAAYVSNGAATGLYLAVAACIERRLGKRYYYLSRTEVAQMDIVMFKAHRNPYDLVIGQLGAQYRELSFPNNVFPPTPEDLRAAIGDHTAAVYYVQSGWTPPGALSLEETIAVAKECGVPVIVDAAAQLPPVENLWHFTAELGADLALFSGGKDLRGPQSSGLVVGSRELIEIMTSIGFPNYGVGRMMKVGREELVGLYSAVKQYLEMDHPARSAWCEKQIELAKEMLSGSTCFKVERSFPNEAGQPIARAFVEIIRPDITPEQVRTFLLDGTPSIWADSEGKNGIYLNPMTLKENEMSQIALRLREFCQQREG